MLLKILRDFKRLKFRTERSKKLKKKLFFLSRCQACKALEPKHKDWKSQTTASPFKIDAKKNGDVVDVTISGTEKFKGFLLVAKDASSKNVGTWELVDKAKLLKCDNDNVSLKKFFHFSLMY